VQQVSAPCGATELRWMGGARMESWLSVTSADERTQIEELRAWLAEEPGIRGRIRHVGNRAEPGQLGFLTDVLAVAVGSGGTLTVLASSLSVWLKQPRRSDVRVTVHAPDKTVVDLSAQRCTVAEVEGVLRACLQPGLQVPDTSS
jgi:hypothetical protein